MRFRAWLIEEKQMIYSKDYPFTFFEEDYWIGSPDTRYDYYHGKDEFILMRSLGKDRYDTDVYEGDLFHETCEKYDGTIEIYNSVFILEPKLESSCGCCTTIYGWDVGRSRIEEIKIIGNIYENPELLPRND